MVGLAPSHAGIVKDAFKERSKAGMTLFVSTHQLNVAEELAERIGIMDKGRLIAVGSANELRQQSGAAGPLEDVFLALTTEDETTSSQGTTSAGFQRSGAVNKL
jgi:ABC-2 type transport system ATP-binding protein